MSKMSRFTRAAVCVLAGALGPWGLSVAQDAPRYPVKPIKIVVPGAPGGLSDLLARLVGERLSASMGQPVIMDHKTGAGGIVTIQAAKGQTDGYTLMYHYTAYNQNLAFRRSNPYVHSDFVPVAQIATAATGMYVSSSLGVNTVAELVNLVKANPGKYAYGSVGIGSTGQIMMEMLAKSTDVRLTHAPYKAESPGLNDLLGGQIAIFSGGSLGAFMPHVKSGRIKALALAAEKRVASAPDVPTWMEAGYPAIVLPSWTGIFAAAGTPQAIVNRLSDEITRIVRDPEVAKRIEAAGALAAPRTASEFASFVDEDLKRWQNAAKVTGITLD